MSGGELTHGSLFTGVGGFDLGFDAAGMRSIWQSEYDPTPISDINPNPRPLAEQWNHRVLARHWPDVTNHGDIHGIERLDAADVISFGSPCQDLSVAGRRGGLEGEKSGLFFEAARIIDQCRPALAVWENVPGAFSSNAGRDFRAVVDTMVKLGARDVAWRVIDSQYAGVPQRRRRIYLVADFRGERAGKILFDADRCGGHYPPSEETRKTIADRIARGADGALASTLGGRVNRHYRRDNGGFVLEDQSENAVAAALQASGPPGTRRDDHEIVIVAETLTKGGKTSGRRQEDDYNLVAGLERARDSKGLGFEADASLVVVPDVSPTLQVGTYHHGSINNQTASDGGFLVVEKAAPVAFEARVARNGRGAPSDIVPPLKAQSGADGRGDASPLVFDRQQVTSRANRSRPERGDPSHSLTGEAPSLARYGTVRRFTPTECERLQGFPDGWTCLCGSGGDMFACKCPDGPRYRALGNAVTVTVTYWLGLRIVEALS